MVDALIQKAEERMTHAIEHAQHEFATLRTGRANPAMLDRIQVDYYGSPTPINQLANISVPEPRQLLISPYDKSALAAIEKAIMKSDLGITPNTDSSGIRLIIPPMTEERRKDLVKQLHKLAEEARVAIRNVRRDTNDHIKAEEKNKQVSEDERKRAEEKVQKLTDKQIEKLDGIAKEKEKELLEV